MATRTETPFQTFLAKWVCAHVVENAPADMDAADVGHEFCKARTLDERLKEIAKGEAAISSASARKTGDIRRVHGVALKASTQARKDAESGASSSDMRRKVQKDFKRYHDLN